MEQKVALVSGGSGGLGWSTSEYLARQGWKVYVSDCQQELLTNLPTTEGIHTLVMDVTKQDSIDQAFQYIQKETPYLDAIINFAGILKVGSMAEMPEETLALLMDINVMGTFRVNQRFLPLLYSARKGRIINISSETGWQSGAPFNGAYAMSKHAIEAYSDSLRRELSLLDIPVIKIQPGPFKTSMVASIETNFNLATEQSTLFKDSLGKIKHLAINEQGKAHPPELLAQTIYKALEAKKPKAAYSVKADPARRFLEILPTSWADALLKAVIKKTSS